ncbi:outer membrane lipoprotein chaperone LolA [Aestuariibacter sp. A3R04]|uniref:outer membrane lipoprotein chaperone LolA n=1 Tax=Aestuariibacter sp. A3R04 TaxID=2841571 RepID=UPI001C09766F|nr:outer membrane lipoprotein chaperone LolA [Aestuariibacter sp. A3R04]MBU3022821.1 outer membrane lipoprotein chaperone LolA [Aestuariibacter sp. A3R04]
MKPWIKTLFLMITGSVFALSVHASVTPKEMLKRHLSELHYFSASFSQVVSDGNDELVHEAKGVLYLARPDKLRWETRFPDESLLIADGDSVWNIDPFVEQVTILDQEAAIKDNPFMLLISTDDTVWEKFTVSADNQHPERYTVTPNSVEGQVRALVFSFTEGTLQSLSVRDAQDQTSLLSFSDINTKTPPQQSLFQARVSDTYVVDDQR